MNLFSKARISYYFERVLLFLKLRVTQLSYLFIPFLCFLFGSHVIKNKLVSSNPKIAILVLLLVILSIALIKIIRYYQLSYYFNYQLKILKYATEIKEELLIVLSETNDPKDLLVYIDYYIRCALQLRSFIEKHHDSLDIVHFEDCMLILKNCSEVVNQLFSSVEIEEIKYLLNVALQNLDEIQKLLISLSYEE